jgi:hypothetical protein
MCTDNDSRTNPSKPLENLTLSHMPTLDHPYLYRDWFFQSVGHELMLNGELLANKSARCTTIDKDMNRERLPSVNSF